MVGETAVFDGDCAGGVPDEYLRRLLLEIRRESGNYKEWKVDTVFVGGGTPSLLLPRQITDLMKGIYQSFQLVPDAEITIEANPGTLTKEKLVAYRQAGVNRLSIGLQSADDRELARLGRIHRFEDFRQNFELARACGFQNINIDLMSGLPGQKAESWIHTLHTAVGFCPEHISAYGLIIEEGTPFYQKYGNGAAAGEKDGEKLPSEEEERQMYHDTGDILDRYGYRQYEISNYAKSGYECRHNIGYWIRKDYAGFGLGAASMVNNRRWKNTSDLHEYMKYTDEVSGAERKAGTGEESRVCKTDVSVLTVQEQMEETMFLGLRMNRGVSKSEFETLYGVRMEEIYGTWLRRMIAEGLLLDGACVCLSERGRDLANYVMAGFLQD